MLVAIYSRKSKWTGKGESVENQILMCKEYLTHVLHLTKEAKIREYVDEGFSGKNTKRPAFIKMLADMEAEHFDYLVCYKLDRLAALTQNYIGGKPNEEGQYTLDPFLGRADRNNRPAGVTTEKFFKKILE